MHAFILVEADPRDHPKIERMWSSKKWETGKTKDGMTELFGTIPREIKLYDVTFPEKYRDMVLSEYYSHEEANTHEAKGTLMGRVMSFFLKFFKGLKPIDRSKLTKESKLEELGSRDIAYCKTLMLGTMEDNHDANGNETV